MTDSNLGPLELEATALPTEQQPLWYVILECSLILIRSLL